jgi:serine/threonine protein kinase
MTKARRLGVTTPVLYSVDPVLHTLTFEFVEGPSVKDVFLEFGSHGVVEERLDDIALQVGDAIGKLHDGGLIHGDLTTSNMLLRSGTNQLVSFLFLVFLLVGVTEGFPSSLSCYPWLKVIINLLTVDQYLSVGPNWLWSELHFNPSGR